MYSFQQLYYYLMAGSDLTVMNSFQEPSLGPITGTMKTTRQIGDEVKAMLDQSTVTAADVKQGKLFFCTQEGNWGIHTGTAIVITPTP
jgi:hypothetical protein